MKFSDYLIASPNSPRVQQTVTVRDENREALLEQQVSNLTEQLTKHTDQLDIIDELKRKNANLTKDKGETSFQLNDATATLASVSIQLEKQTELKDTIKSFQQQIITKETSLADLHLKFNEQQRDIIKQQDDIVTLRIDKNLLEDGQTDLQRRTRFAEQKHTDITGEIQFVKGKFTELEAISYTMTEQYTQIQNELNERVGQSNLLRATVQMLKEELETARSSNTSLHESLNSLQEFYTQTKDELTYSDKESHTLEKSLASVLDTLTKVENENSYLMDKQHYLEATLSKPRYMSEASIVRSEGFRMPLGSSALNVKKNYLGTGKPTLLKFKKKEFANDN